MRKSTKHKPKPKPKPKHTHDWMFNYVFSYENGGGAIYNCYCGAMKEERE